MSIRKGDTVIAGAYNLEKVQDGVARRNVGDVFWTMRKDTSNDGINGAYDCNGREFLSTDFQGDQSPYTLLVEGLLPSVTYEQYEQELTNNNGNCGYFALDTTAQKFKVPTYSEISILSGNLQDIGKYIPDGVPETALGSITVKGNVQSNGIAQLDINESGYYEQWYSNDMGLLSQEPITEADVTLGNEVDQVKPKTITLRAMIQLATRGQDISIKQYTDQLDGLVEVAQESANLAQQAAINAAIILKGEYSTTVTYAMNNAVTVTTEEGTQYYISLISDNLNNPVTDTTKWTPWIFIPFVQDGTTGLGVDIGTIITSLKTVPPTGFDKCDGTEVTKTQNENLYQACTSNVQLPVVSLTSLTLIGNSPCASSNENIIANQTETTSDTSVVGSVTFASDVKFYTMNGKDDNSFIGNPIDVSNQTVSIGYVGPTTGTELRWVALGGQIPEGATHAFLVSDTPASKEVYEGTAQPDTSAYTGGSLALLWVDVENNKIYYKTRTAATEAFGEWIEQTDAYIPLTLTSTNGTVAYSRYNNITLEDLNDYSYTQYISNGNCGYLGVDTTLEKVKLPTLNQIFLQGASGQPGLFIEAGLPNIEGEWIGKYKNNTTTVGLSPQGTLSGCYKRGSTVGFNIDNDSLGVNGGNAIAFDASTYNKIYGNSTTVQPESVCVNYYICTSPYSEVVAGATFTPQTQTVETGIELSWTNDRGLVNPTSVVIPKGPQGEAAFSVEIGDVTSSTTPSVTNSGTAQNQIWDITLPKTLGLSLFDIVTKDHILTFEESAGLGLQGTYVYKTAVPGSRYGYPDFYAKCVEEMTAATDEAFTQPILTSNGTMGGNNFAVACSSYYANNDNYNAWRAFNGVIDVQTDLWACANGSDNAFLDFYNPQALKVTSLTVLNRYSGTVGAIRTGNIQACNDGSSWQTIKTFSNDVTTANTSWTIDLSDNENYYCYYRINCLTFDGGYCGINQLTINAFILGKRNSNGHIFYDIAQKSLADSYYEKTGACWMYGVDTTNERIFLPRTTRFQFTSDTSKVGAYQEAGLPNIEGRAGINSKTQSGAFYRISDGLGYPASEGATHSTAFDASSSNPIYGSSDTVTPAATNQLLYIVVGNTEVESAATDITDVTTTENDTIPLFTGMYYDFVPNHVSWLKAGQQANSGGLYTSAYNTLVSELTNPTYGLKVIDVDDMEADTDYSLYWKVDQTNQTFTTPTRTEERILVAKKEPTTEDPTWYNWYSDGWLEQGGQGLDSNNITSRTFSFLKPYQSKPVVLAIQNAVPETNLGYVTTGPTSTDVLIRSSASWIAYQWYACGYGSIPQLTNYTEDIKLYFKVNNAVQNKQLIDIGEVTEALADKIGTTECKAYITETYENGTSGYVVYSNGLCEQWGVKPYISGQEIVKLLKNYINTDYNVQTTYNSGNLSNGAMCVYNMTTTSFDVKLWSTQAVFWRACGYIS